MSGTGGSGGAGGAGTSVDKRRGAGGAGGAGDGTSGDRQRRRYPMATPAQKITNGKRQTGHTRVIAQFADRTSKRQETDRRLSFI
jgi:hypothetical protein